MSSYHAQYGQPPLCSLHAMAGIKAWFAPPFILVRASGAGGSACWATHDSLPTTRSCSKPGRRMARPACLPKSDESVLTGLCYSERCAVVLVALQLARKSVGATSYSFLQGGRGDSTGGPATATNTAPILPIAHMTKLHLLCPNRRSEEDPIARGLAPLLHISSGPAHARIPRPFQAP
ncbi:hypothetical protein M433DRAFT_420014 [Acidomyces richmondensis BFW]|nr:hypothetical protein M433DRAFT_420014 [Acidomyces richmondensis BFW]